MSSAVVAWLVVVAILIYNYILTSDTLDVISAINDRMYKLLNNALDVEAISSDYAHLNARLQAIELTLMRLESKAEELQGEKAVDEENDDNTEDTDEKSADDAEPPTLRRNEDR